MDLTVGELDLNAWKSFGLGHHHQKGFASSQNISNRALFFQHKAAETWISSIKLDRKQTSGVMSIDNLPRYFKSFLRYKPHFFPERSSLTFRTQGKRCIWKTQKKFRDNCMAQRKALVWFSVQPIDC